MDAKTKKLITDLGFELTDEGKHIKGTYFGDDRYQIVFSKTPSESRTGKNTAQEIIRKIL